MYYRPSYPAYNNCRHIIACVKYRRRAITPAIRKHLSGHIERMAAMFGTLHAYAVAADHVHILIQSDLSPEKVTGALTCSVAREIRKDFPELEKLNRRCFWGGKSCTNIRDENHMKNAMAYIGRHTTDERMTENDGRRVRG